MIDGIIITISAKMIKERGYRNWLRDYLDAMAIDTCSYWMKLGAKPKKDVLYVYLCIGGLIRFRSIFMASYGPSTIAFNDGRRMFGKAWVEMTGPLERAPNKIARKGFRGFRYTEKIW